ncbi:DUF3574 domain-containing protein [Streptomyces acidicola]|uniref:DUF3574 domain-containing protein n=1 Tax=Streptomyces acidicola TaxID=2596892 RepID=UPI0037F9DA2D
MTWNFTRTRTRVALATAGILLTVAPTAYATLGGSLGSTLGGSLGGPGRDETREAAAPVRGAAFVETRLLFGTERPDGGQAVTAAQFTDFVDREVTPLFPDGLTVQEGRGQWRDAGGTIEKERSYELILLYPAREARASDRKIEEIRADYRKAFAQEAVARVDDRKRVDF